MPNWFYTDSNGSQWGPINDQQLHELVAQGIITPNTPMETDTGHTGVAGKIPGLFAATFPFSAQAGTTAYQIFCTNCGNSTTEHAVACLSCGASPIGHRRFCRHCAAALNPAQVVCVSCGSAISTAGASRSVSGSATIEASDKPPFDPTVLLILSIFQTLCCCMPAGVAGIVFSVLCSSALKNGDYETSTRYSQIAFWINIGGLVCGTILASIWFVLVAAGL
jgi:hypothetical protein